MEAFQPQTSSMETIKAKIEAAHAVLKQDRRRGLALLNAIFRAGKPPDPPLQGRYSGALVALDIAPGLTQGAEMIINRWLPWQGKTFDAAQACGDNIFTRDSLALAHLYWPLYRDYIDDGPTYRAFGFRTYVASGLADPDRQVLKIDYNLPGNPRLSIRRILDELMQVADGFYLGKAHLKWWWGTWQLVAYFSLQFNH
ncbi:MAG TPA: hypothetical protein VEC93_07565 [Anaerolineae bacterium]|nr:hypothetical protein [Anaerolineae bacterium]